MVGAALVPPQAICNMQPERITAIIPSPKSFPWFAFPNPNPVRNRAGTTRAARNNERDPGSRFAGRCASASAAAAATLSVALPTPPNTETGVTEQVTGAVTTGLTEQL